MPLEGISRFCFGASYAVALAFELAYLARPVPARRVIGLAFGGAGLFAHTLFLAARRPDLASPSGSLLALAWVLAVFYLFGTLHHRRLAWSVFVLPVVIGLVVLSEAFPVSGLAAWGPVESERAWGVAHGALLLMAAVGVSVGFLASLMYLAQARRLRAKLRPGRGLKLFSLERLEAMNRRALHWAFPLLTAGLLVGAVLMAQGDRPPADWAAPKVLSTLGLWVVFSVLLYLRHAAGVPGRRLALLTVAAFALLVVSLATTHPVVQGGGP
jgi:ABC-type transport system involved in cytochrome c biogenesis permease subunit